MIKSKSWLIPKSKTRPNRAWIHVQPYDYGVLILWPVTGKILKREYLHIASDDGSKWPEEAFESTKGKFLSNGETDCISFLHSKAYLLMYVTDRIYELTRNKPCLI